MQTFLWKQPQLIIEFWIHIGGCGERFATNRAPVLKISVTEMKLSFDLKKSRVYTGATGDKPAFLLWTNLREDTQNQSKFAQEAMET